MATEGFIPSHGGFEKLVSYQKALLIFQATFYLTKRWVRIGSRTRDQMEQAARSGKQNIVEGSLAAATSTQTEIHLTNVARASLGELLEDFKDFLRLRDLPIWDKEHPKAQEIRRLARPGDPVDYETYRHLIESDNPEIVGNTMVCLIHQTCYLLDQQIRRLEQDFLKHGGIRERMTKARLEARDNLESKAPVCPECGKPMRERTARVGANAGKAFWGCSAYPACRGVRKME
jgi:four helix bundle suffix protein